MTPLKILRDAVGFLEKSQAQYCLIGGHAASLYRSNERLTRDVDFALVAKNVGDSRKIAERIIEQVGLKPVVGFIPHTPQEKPRKSVCMITSAPAEGAQKGVLDILLPELPWIPPAVERAQFNKIDLGFARVPVITPEDLIVAKCYALKNAPDRFQDLDDLKEILLSVTELDHDYIRNSLGAFDLILPEAVGSLK